MCLKNSYAYNKFLSWNKKLKKNGSKSLIYVFRWEGNYGKCLSAWQHWSQNEKFRLNTKNNSLIVNTRIGLPRYNSLKFLRRICRIARTTFSKRNLKYPKIQPSKEVLIYCATDLKQLLLYWVSFWRNIYRH